MRYFLYIALKIVHIMLRFQHINIESPKLMLYKKLNELTASRHELKLRFMISRASRSMI